MTTVFIGGSRRVSRLNADIRARIDRIIEQEFDVVVGDANGADKAVQRYLHEAEYLRVEVFCSGDACRNNVGGWPTRHVSTGSRKKRDRAFYTAKDRVMTDEATYGLMIWDGNSAGTLSNVLRLLMQEKKVVLYHTAHKRFTEFHTLDDWDAYAETLAPTIRSKVEDAVASESRRRSPPAQATMF